MSITSRIVVPHYAHHIRERGVRREPLFHEDKDFLVYIRILKSACLEHHLDIWAYVLMTNHEHLVGVPETEQSIAKALQRAHTSYAKYFNAKYGFSGHVWESGPQFCAMDWTHLQNAVRYVERNPVRAGMVKKAEDYLWSSAAAHCGLRDDLLLSGNCPLIDVIENWSEWLRIDDAEEGLSNIRRHTSTGKVWCQPEMLQQFETLTGHSLAARRPGRPRKSKSH